MNRSDARNQGGEFRARVKREGGEEVFISGVLKLRRKFFARSGRVIHVVDVATTMRKVLAGVASELADPSAPAGVLPEQGGLLDGLAEPSQLPDWLTQEDLDFYVAEFSRTGFTG